MLPHANEQQSMRAIRALTAMYRRTPDSQQLTQDIGHVIATYELCDKEAALACNRYIITKYPSIHNVATHYGLRPMSEREISLRSIDELQHMLHGLCLFLYDGLKSKQTEDNKQ